MDELVGPLLSFLFGVVLGILAHRLTVGRSRQERRIADATERIDRCLDIFNAQVNRAVAYNLGDSGRARVINAHKELLKRYPWAAPDKLLGDSAAYRHYNEVQHQAGLDVKARVGSGPERVSRLEEAAEPVVEELLALRERARD
jgi:hypothetical protein